jgi:hypothetical protein
VTLLSPRQVGIAELLADATVTAITTRIRGVEPAEGDEQGPGAYLPFVIVSDHDLPWEAGTATSQAVIALRAYAATHAAAETLYLACAAVFRSRKGPRIATSRLGIYSSYAEGGGTPDTDPDTGQPYRYGDVVLNVSTQPIPA